VKTLKVIDFQIHGGNMKIQILLCLVFISFHSVAQERNLEELIRLRQLAEGERPATLCSDVEWPSNGNCFDYDVNVPVVEAIREALNDFVFVHANSLDEYEIYTEDVGLSSDEIRQRLASAILDDGRRLIDMVLIMEGGIPERFYQRIESRDIQ
tara:strand:+ start:369 stop:830 length:462 start_codon:yes stop_codon:yes gene_type:complete